MVPLVPPRSGCPVPPGPLIRSRQRGSRLSVSIAGRDRGVGFEQLIRRTVPFRLFVNLRTELYGGDSHGIRQKPYVFPPDTGSSSKISRI
jgi:hypothetical protein